MMLPEVIVVGDIELFLLGMGFALGWPSAAKGVLKRVRSVRSGEKRE